MPPPSRADTASSDWLAALRSDGRPRSAAVERLHAFLLGATRGEVSRRAASLPYAAREHLDDLAMQAAADALVAVLAKLDDFRGDCRFTTWAYKFALLESAVALRRRAWQGREVVLDAHDWNRLRASGACADTDGECGETLGVLFACIAEELTPHQREVLVAVAIDGVPIDVLAERLRTTRGALYKTLHDARRKLRACVAERGAAV